MIGKEISHYKILKKLGSGGMGEVYLAEDTKLKRRVALKFLPQGLDINQVDVARFLQEAQAAAAINHANVCTIYEVQDEGDAPFIAMEYVEGKTLREKIKEERLKIKDVQNIANQVCEGLLAAHEKGIVHRDIKSDNIMITESGQVKVMDFGLAKLKGTLKLTKTGSTAGTLSYMAPEYIQGGDADTRSDIFSLGVVLYEMLTGELPFKGDYEAAQMYSILNEDPEPVQKSFPGLSSEMLHILNRSLEKDPANRYQSVNDLVIDLRRLKRDESKSHIDIPTASFGNKKKYKISTIKLLFITFAFIILAIIVNAVLDIIPPQKPSLAEKLDERSVTILYFDNQTGDANMDHWRKAITDLIIADISQSKYLNVLSSDKLVKVMRDLDQSDVSSYSADVLVEIVDKARTKNVVYGSITKAGDIIRINLTINEPATGQLVGIETVEGRGEESIFRMVDDLTTRIKTRFNYTTDEIASDIDKDVANITTNSAEAYKYYMKGRELHDNSKFRESIENMEKAVEIDPGFALAYRSMAVSNGNLTYWSERNRLLEKAMELSDQLSDREKFLIQGDYYSSSDKAKAILAYEQVIEMYPWDGVANNNLGFLYSGIEKYKKAVKCYETAIKRDPVGFTPYLNTAYAYTQLAEYEKVREVLEKYQVNYGDNANIHQYYSDLFLYDKKYDNALIENKIALKLDPDNYSYLMSRGDIFLLHGDLIRAETEYRKMLEFEEVSAKIWGHIRLICLNLYLGKTVVSEKHTRQGLKLSMHVSEERWQSLFYNILSGIEQLRGNFNKSIQLGLDHLTKARIQNINFSQRWAFSRLIQNYIRIGNLTEAQIRSNEIKKLYEGYINEKLIRSYYYTEGMIKIEQGEYAAAIDSLHLAISLLKKNPTLNDHAQYFFTLAQAYYENNELDKAEEWYKRIVELTSGRVYAGTLYALSLYHLGKIYEEMGDLEKSEEFNGKFLKLWKEADFDSPELTDAKKRLKIKD